MFSFNRCFIDYPAFKSSHLVEAERYSYAFENDKNILIYVYTSSDQAWNKM